jgi:hypothetical protein
MSERDVRDDFYTVEDGWIETYSGVQFHFGDPALDEINIVDIAHALSLLCRYNGHCTRFYSVAEHSVLMTRHFIQSQGSLPKAHWRRKALTVLLHDAAEAYIGDLPRPIKHKMDAFKAVESILDQRVAQRFGTIWPLPSYVKERDSRILCDEREQAMPPSDNEWGTDSLIPLGVTLEFWAPVEAEAHFLHQFFELAE